jgi:hypothetical protein
MIDTPLAGTDDVAAALRRPVTAPEAEHLDDLLHEASDLVIGYLHPTPTPTPTPGAITRVVAAMAAAVLIRPADLMPDAQTLSADGFGVTFSDGGNSTRPFLTAALKARLRPYRSGALAVALGRFQRPFRRCDDIPFSHEHEHGSLRRNRVAVCVLDAAEALARRRRFTGNYPHSAVRRKSTPTPGRAHGPHNDVVVDVRRGSGRTSAVA